VTGFLKEFARLDDDATTTISFRLILSIRALFGTRNRGFVVQHFAVLVEAQEPASFYVDVSHFDFTSLRSSP
jgi:hypothetical protein